MGILGEKSAMQKKIIYGLMLVGLTMLYASYVPHLLDYYVVRPQDSFFEFYHRNILDETYTFEGIIMGLVLAGLYCVTLNAGVSTLILSAALFVLTYAGYLKYVNRRELLRLDDLRLTEAAGMAAEYIRFEYSPFLLLLVGGLLAFTAAGFGAELFRRRFHAQPVQEAGQAKHPRPRWVMPAARVLGILAVCGTLAGYTHHFFQFKLRWDEVDTVILTQTISDRYVLYQFLRNDSLLSVNAGDVEESHAYLMAQGAALSSAQEATVYPNVVVIMNEAWWNTDWLDPSRITFSVDPMGPYKQLETQCGSGYLTTNIYGGGTVSSEAEFLTGLNTKYYVSASGIYEQTMGRKLPSVVDYFNALDYETTAIHPYYGEFYGRDQVYPQMGFDHILFEEDMQYRDIYTRYISDDALASQIIAQYESAESKRQFIWAVSVANHGMYLEYSEEFVEDYDYPVSFTLQEELKGKEDNLELINYINGIYLANQAYARLAEYFSGREEPVILVMYGDHVLNFSEDTFGALGFDTAGEEYATHHMTVTESGTEEDVEFGGWQKRREADTFPMDQRRKIYSVPVLLWSNSAAEELCCREEKPSFKGESIYYLPQMLLDYAGLPDSEMTLALRYERSLFRANSRAFVLDAGGEVMQQCTEEQMRGLRCMQIVEYDILFGEGICRDIWIPLRIN